jgi:hypothetical protein
MTAHAQRIAAKKPIQSKDRSENRKDDVVIEPPPNDSVVAKSYVRRLIV